MNMRKTVKKIAALVAGTTMVGATIMGAMALDLSNYPAPFVTSGVFDGKIVIGSSAATSDVVGAIDVAASLQAAATTTTKIDVPGAAGKATVTGDSFEFSTASDLLGIGEYLGEIRTSLLDTDLNALKSGVLTTSKGSTPVKQYLKFEEAEGGVVVFDEDSDNDVLGDFLYFDKNDVIFEYNMDFPEGAESDNQDGVLDDIEGEMITLLGAPYTVVEATVDDAEISLTMLGGQVADTLKDGETKTYTFGGEDYEVTAIFISDSDTAKLSVNGMLTGELDEGETEILGDGEITLGIQEVLTNQREGIVEFYLGAEKLVMVDSNFSDDDWEDCNVEVAGEAIDSCEQVISGDEMTGDEFKINNIHYRLLADDYIYVPSGKGVKEMLEEPQGMLGSNWDIKYLGLMKTGTSEIKFNPDGDEAYFLDFVNNRGTKYSFPLVIDVEDSFFWGEEDDHIVWTEPGASTDPIGDNLLSIPMDGYFIVSDKEDNTDERAITSVLQYTDFSDSESQITVKELGGGESNWNYEGDPGDDATGTMTIEGTDHTFWVGTDGDYIAVDLDGTGELEASAIVNVMFKGEGYIEMPEQTFTNESLDEATEAGELFILTTPKEQFDDQPVVDETTNITISADSDAGDEAVSLALAGAGDTISDPEVDDWEYGLSTYGVYFKLFDSSDVNEAEELTIEYPLSREEPKSL